MGISITVEPGKVHSWEDFKRTHRPFSIGLDGIVNSRTMRDPSGPYANFDHHAGCDRMSTRSTSEQVYLEINMGLFETFRKNGIPQANLCINDPDEDTCLAVWLLRNHERLIGKSEPTINRLVFCEDRLDTTAGAYPLGDTAIHRTMAWIFEPYTSVRAAGTLLSAGEHGIRNIVDAVGQRITDYTLGRGQEKPVETDIEILKRFSTWALTRECGPAARTALYASGINAFVSTVSVKDGVYVYSIGRRSVWYPFDLDSIYAALNKAEKARITKMNCWGGSNTIGGSPRKTGSKLEPDEVAAIINKTIAAK